MKKDIHPPYHTNATVQCACGNTFEVGATQETIETEICSACHPFYTGKEKFVDTAGRIEKFKARMEKSEQIARAKPVKKKRVAKAKAEETPKKKPAAKKKKKPVAKKK